MNLINETLFFESVRQALTEEEKELHQLFEQNSNLYRHQNIHGIGCLYETTLVYLVWKQLMRNQFPLEVSWEHPYPDNHTLHADMALLAENRQVDSLVEYKLWTSEDAREIRGDVEKYQSCSFQGGKYLLVFELYGGNLDANTEYLLHSFPNVSLVKRATIASSVYDNVKQIDVTKPIHIYMLKMK